MIMSNENIKQNSERLTERHAMVDEVELLQHTVLPHNLFLNNANEQLITFTQIRK